MAQSTDQIKREIEEARERISETTSEIGERIRSTFDWRQQVADHPWAAVGLAAAAGFLLGAAGARAMRGGEPAVEAYGDGHAPGRARREAEAQAPPPGATGSEWAGTAEAAAAGETGAAEAAEARSAGEVPRGPRRYGMPRETGREGRGWRASAGTMAGALTATLTPQLEEIGHTLAEQLKDLSNYLIAQGKEFMKERVDEWRRGTKPRARYGGAEQPGGTAWAEGSTPGPAAGGSTLSSEAAGPPAGGPATGTGPTAGSRQRDLGEAGTV